MDRTVKELIALGKGVLHASGYECVETDSETLLGHVLGMNKAELFLNHAKAVDEEKQKLFEKLVDRVAGGEPMQYVMGEAYFMGHRFSVNPDVLIPRPETEVLCEMAIRELSAYDRATSVLDLCTGSGALAVSIALAVEKAHLTASDISTGALTTAQANASALSVSSRIDFIKSNLFDELTGRTYDMIVTNPPYIKTSELANLPSEVRDHEPEVALDGGTDGFDFYNRIVNEASSFLACGGTILAETGCDQGLQVKAAFEAAGFSEVSISKDLAGRDRIVRAVKN